MTDNLAFVFPGQGSQSLGMLAELATVHGAVRESFDEASDGCGLDLWALSQQGPEDQLTLTANAQPAIMAHAISVWRVLEKEGGVTLSAAAVSAAGHSLG